MSSSLPDATANAGFTPLPGSGVAEQLKKSSTLQFNFFNLYKWSNETNFFSTYTSELAADGTIRILSDTGIEGTRTTSKLVDTMRIHFTATATEDTQGALVESTPRRL